MNPFSKHIIKVQSLNYIFLILSSLIFFQSCNFFDKNEYNEGYKEGYLIGFSAGKKTQNQSAQKEDKNTIASNPNYNSATTEDKLIQVANTSIPKQVFLILDFIKKYDKAPENYIGGRYFGNYEQHLPERNEKGKLIKYREWDIYPNVEGKSRGMQRLITASDGRSWYTADHYNSFTEVK